MISLKSLEKMNVCSDGILWYKENRKKTLLETLELTDNQTINYFNWFVSRKLSKENKIHYAIFAAEQVIDIFEKKYPNDNRPRKAIEAAKNYLKDPSAANKKVAYAAAAAAAYAAAYATNAAAYAADAAAYAAYAADAAAAYAAAADAYATNATAHAATDAGYNIKKIIVLYGLKLLKEQGIN
jgi:hypothetical protein